MVGPIGRVAALIDCIVELVVTDLAGIPIGDVAIGLVGVSPVRMHGQGAIGAGEGIAKSAGISGSLNCAGSYAGNL